MVNISNRLIGLTSGMLIRAGLYKSVPEHIDMIAIPDEKGKLKWKRISQMVYTGKPDDDFDRLERYYLRNHVNRGKKQFKGNWKKLFKKGVV